MSIHIKETTRIKKLEGSHNAPYHTPEEVAYDLECAYKQISRHCEIVRGSVQRLMVTGPRSDLERARRELDRLNQFQRVWAIVLDGALSKLQQ